MKYNANEDKHNKFRKLIKNHFSHTSCTASTRDGLMAFELWGGLSSEEMKKRITELKKYDINIETLKRSIPFFRSDYQCNFNENPEVLQTHNSCISHYLPYNGCTSKPKNDTYAIRSSYSSS